MKVEILKSKTGNKRFKVIIDGTKTVNFGINNAYTYFDGADDEKKQNYLKRHSKLNENWNKSGIETAGFWSRWYNWELQNPTKEEQKTFFKNKFNVDLDIKYFKKNAKQ